MLVAALAVNVAETLRVFVIDTVQLVLLPPQAPLQPLKLYPEAAEAVSVTEVPDAYEPEQEPPQLIPEGLLVTVPEPDFETDSVYEAGGVGLGEGDGDEVDDELDCNESPVLHAPSRIGTSRATAIAFSGVSNRA